MLNLKCVNKKGAIMKHTMEVKLNVLGTVVLSNHALLAQSDSGIKSQSYDDQINQHSLERYTEIHSNTDHTNNAM